MRTNASISTTVHRLLALLVLGIVPCPTYGDEGEEAAAERLIREQVNRRGTMSDQEYEDGMEQKKLSISDPAEALREEFWNPCASLGLGDGYSVIMQIRQAHPIVAEYHRRVMVFAGDARRGKLAGSLQLRMNFGGRTHMLVYRHLDADGRVTHVTFEAREGGEQTIRLDQPDFEEAPNGHRKEYLGLISGEAYPLKFMTPLVVPEKLAREKLE